MQKRTGLVKLNLTKCVLPISDFLQRSCAAGSGLSRMAVARCGIRSDAAAGGSTEKNDAHTRAKPLRSHSQLRSWPQGAPRTGPTARLELHGRPRNHVARPAADHSRRRSTKVHLGFKYLMPMWHEQKLARGGVTSLSRDVANQQRGSQRPNGKLQSHNC